ncbi:hypothetical protein C8R45DRAFT_1087748 [Mycena sanguinolenta]|nr:hypothetical protein C8R45DRAFT_1087748 [Mycena sanguinolenta]
MHLGDARVWVAVDDVELSEFAVEYSADGKEASCWIPSECGKNFSINWEHTNASGLTVDAVFFWRKLLPTSGSVFFDNLLGAAISPELGSIKVEVRNVRKVPRSAHQPPAWANRSYETPVLHEKSKKAIGHTVRFGAEFAAVNNATKVRAKFIGELGMFSFKYRPIGKPPPFFLLFLSIHILIQMLDLLRAQGIAPPAARPARAASSSSAVVLDLTMDDADDDAGEIDIKPETNKLEVRAKITELEASRSRSSLLPSRPHA